MATTDSPQDEDLAQADRLDAEGQHREAVNVLARAARLGNRDAKLRLGARLLLGDRAPSLGPQGAGLIEEAGREGDGDAAHLTAVINAAGIYRPIDWAGALDWLAQAAVLGEPRARGALAALAGEADPVAVSQDVAPSDGFWASLRAKVAPASITTAPEARTLNDSPLVRAFADFASTPVCAWLMHRASGRLSRAAVYDAVSQKEEFHRTRTNTAAGFGLFDTDLAQTAVQARMAAAVQLPLSHLEAPTILHYAVGEEITEHFDFIDPRAPDHDVQVARDGQRSVTFLLYLNEDYEGGETVFPRLDLSHKGSAGEGLFFVNAHADGKADVRTVHAARSPVSGEKWIVSQFIRNRPVLPGASGGVQRPPSAAD